MYRWRDRRPVWRMVLGVLGRLAILAGLVIVALLGALIAFGSRVD